jgi:hypothetical protein
MALKKAVEPRPTDLGQLAHSLDTQIALQRHLGFRRRRLRARDIVPLASSLDFLQGTSEKIHLHRLVSQQPLQFADFSTKRRFSGVLCRRRPFRQSIFGLQLIPPLVEQSAAYSQVSRQPHNVLARVHSLDRSATEFLAVPFSPFSFHFAAPFLQSVFCKMFQSRDSVTYLQIRMVNYFSTEL